MTNSVETLIRTSVLRGVEALAAFNRSRLPALRSPHPFLSGIHRPMTEELTLTELPVTGTLPDALDGRYLRIGPNPVAPEPASYHWFLGDGMVHGLCIQDGRVLWYRNRWIRSGPVGAALGLSPAPGPRHGGFDTVNTNVAEVGGRTFALVEAASYPVELSETLEVQTYNPFDGTLAGSFTAHPHRDPKTGEHHAICYEAQQPEEIRHVVIDPGGKVVRELAIPVRHGPSIHDCGLTQRYVVILDLPVTFSMAALIGGHGFPYRWNADHDARVGLLPRDGAAADIVWCAVDPAYVFHVANACDLPDGQVVMDVCAYDRMFEGRPLGPNGRSRGLERWTIDPANRRVAVQTLDGSAQEFPRIDERRFGQAHQFVYTLALPEIGEVDAGGAEADKAAAVGATALYRHDLRDGTRQVHDFGPGRYPGEFVFIPNAPDSAEGEGWLMGLVIDLAAETTELAVLDTMAFQSAPVARVHLPHRVPPGFHGAWIPAPVPSGGKRDPPV